MEWIKDKKEISKNAKVPIKSWCPNPEAEALQQAYNLAEHPEVFSHVALMPDCHVGFGMPIGGVIACLKSVIPNAVGVDIGCGMGTFKTSLHESELNDKALIRSILESIKKYIPVGEGNSHSKKQSWHEFENYLSSIKGDLPGWLESKNDCFELDRKNLGTLGGGNHFIEIQKDADGNIWVMLHSGSRNLGYRVANYYHKIAQNLNSKWNVQLPSKDLAYLPVDSEEGQHYLRDMKFALSYAAENRKRMLSKIKEILMDFFPNISFIQEINIHHNYANLEEHFGKKVWVHRKGATSARKGELGIIPGSMGTSSYIVEGKGNPDSFQSCSHGAGRTMGRAEASRKLSVEEANKAMEGIVFDRWHKLGGKKRNGEYDLSEAPQAYKDIDLVISQQLDLITPVAKLKPLGVVKG